MFGRITSTRADAAADGLALRCDRQGQILEVIRDDFGLLDGVAMPYPLASLIDSGSHGKARNFINTVIRSEAALGWELVVSMRRKLTVLYFGAATSGSGMMMIATMSSEELATYTHYLFKHEQLPENINMNDAGNISNERWVQMTALNNELTNAQRELAKSNIELEAMNRQLLLMQQTIRRQQEALVVANRRLAHKASRDPLTGLHNRRAMNARLHRLSEEGSLSPKSLSLLMVDVDHFKQINDKYGHQAGDEVLQQLAEILKSTARRGDMVVRYGGEEFALILPDCDQIQAFGLSQRMLVEVRKFPWKYESMTVSIGVSTTLTRDLDLRQLIHQADHALYHCKHNKRDQAIHFESIKEILQTQGTMLKLRA